MFLVCATGRYTHTQPPTSGLTCKKTLPASSASGGASSGLRSNRGKATRPLPVGFPPEPSNSCRRHSGRLQPAQGSLPPNLSRPKKGPSRWKWEGAGGGSCLAPTQPSSSTAHSGTEVSYPFCLGGGGSGLLEEEGSVQSKSTPGGWRGVWRRSSGARLLLLLLRLAVRSQPRGFPICAGAEEARQVEGQPGAGSWQGKEGKEGARRRFHPPAGGNGRLQRQPSPPLHLHLESESGASGWRRAPPCRGRARGRAFSLSLSLSAYQSLGACLLSSLARSLLRAAAAAAAAAAEGGGELARTCCLSVPFSETGALLKRGGSLPQSRRGRLRLAHSKTLLG